VDVRLLTSLVTPDRAYDHGDVFTCDDQTARRLIASGQAVPVSVGGLELAVSDAPERAVMIQQKKSKDVRR
jgi:hypothetical protein